MSIQQKRSKNAYIYVLEQFAEIEKHRENKPLFAIAKKQENRQPENTVHCPPPTNPT
jgi:hypothetical protein